MKVIIRAAGLIKSGPERELLDDYMKRARGLSRNFGITAIEESAIDLRGAKSRADETQSLLSITAPNSIIVIMDERGKSLTSRQIAGQMMKWREAGHSEVIFAIGGADGFEPDALPAGHIKWRFGQQVWPHKLLRVMLAEQIYRALSILAKTPYHRD